MTISLNLPKDVELRLLAEVRAGRHSSVEDAILEKLSRSDEPDILALTGMTANAVRKDLDDAWNNRAGAVDGDTVFNRLRAKAAPTSNDK